MLFLIYKAGMDAGLAFKITESVRKGKGLTPEWIEEMKRCKVPQWYIDSCLQDRVHVPESACRGLCYFRRSYRVTSSCIIRSHYYATYFTVRAEDFDLELLCQGYDAILQEADRNRGKRLQCDAEREEQRLHARDGARDDGSRLLVQAHRSVSFGSNEVSSSTATRLSRRSGRSAGSGKTRPATSRPPGMTGSSCRSKTSSRSRKATKTIIEVLDGHGLLPRTAGIQPASLF